ncbi:lamin tail domain-containing protein [Lacinutrix salivirga]
MKHLQLLIVAVLFTFSYSYSQTIYTENFNGQALKGAFYTTMTEVDTNGVNWSVDVTGTLFAATNDWFQVRNGRLTGRDTGGPAIWYSPILNTSAFTNIGFSLEAEENVHTEANDSYVTQYTIDNGVTWITATTNGNLIGGTFTTATVSETGITGGSLQLRVIMTNNGNRERFWLDNVTVTGTPNSAPVIIANPNGISGLSYVEGNVSLEPEIFTVQGFNLTTDITITAPASFEIATNPGGPFSSSIVLPITSGSVALTNIYVQLVFGLPVNTYNETITITSSALPNETVSAQGEVFATTPATDCAELFISEYHESAPGTPEEQYIELYNPSTTSIDLANYQLARFTNGSTNPPLLTNLVGTVAPYSTFLISRNGSALCDNGVADQCNAGGAIVFTGNDVMALQTRDGVNIDVIGTIGVNTNFARDIVLRRNEDVLAPTPTYTPSQWTSTPSNNTSKLGSHLNDCQCPATTTWDGTNWDNGNPDSSTQAILNASYDTATFGSFNACSLLINTNPVTTNPEFRLTVSNNTFVEIENSIEVNGELYVETQGNFVQNNDSALFTLIGSGTALVNKETTPLNSVFEYTYWSSPAANVTVANGLAFANPGRRFWFNAANFEDVLIENANTNTFTPGSDDIDDNGDDWTFVTNPTASSFIMEPGMGFASTHSNVGFVSGNQYTYTFEGPLHNGQYTRAIAYNGANGDNDWNLIGNPYPSALDAYAFLDANTSVINGVIYLWSQNTLADPNASGSQGQNFTDADYAIITRNSGNTAGGDGVTPDNFVPSGQGFFVQGLANAEVTFTNAMRMADATSNTLFFRNNSNNNNSTPNRLWLNLTTDTNIFNQMLVAYVDGGTNGYDGGAYDASRSLGSGISAMIYTKIDNDPRKFAIQGKNPSSLDIDEVIPVSFKSNVTASTLYTLSIDHFEGDFLNNNTIYLKDNYMTIVHDLNASDYTFTSEAGEFDDRFEIIFNPNTLSVDQNEIATNTISILELANDNVQFSVSQDTAIKNITIYDALGRVLYNLKGNNSTEIYNLSKLSQAPYVAQIELSNGITISKKAIKK